MYLGYQNEKIKFYTETLLDIDFYNLEKIEETDLEYVLEGEEYVLKDKSWFEKQAQIEAGRIAKLHLTRADVERGIYQARGMDFDDILAFVVENQFTDLDVKALKIELNANHFYRGNPYVDIVGKLLGFTTKQLDKFFEFNDYNYLILKDGENDILEGEEK